MKIHEYQAKGILKKYGVTVPRGTMATSPEEAEAAARELFSAGATGVVVKAQIHAGGRGKGGGVKIAKSVNEAGELAGKMLGMKLVTHQTGPEGRIVRRLLIEETLPIEKELYLGILVDRAEGKPVFMASAAGGMEIEQVAAENPDAILKQHIDPGMGLEAFQARKMAFKLGLNAKQINPAVQFLSNLYKAFLDTDASLLEINPFITTTDGRLFALDAKMNFDDNALFRHPDIRELRDITEEDPLEVEASKYSLNYIKLDGSVGLHGQWRGPGDGDDGHHQVRRRHAGELSRRGRRSQRRAGRARIRNPAQRQEREGGADQYFWRHPARGYAGHGRRGSRDRRPTSSCPSCCASKARTWTQGKKILMTLRIQLRRRRHDEGRGGQSGGRGETVET